MTGRKRALNAFFLVLIFVATLYFVLHGEDLGELLGLIGRAQMGYWALSVGCVVGFILGEAVIIAYLLRTLGQRVRGFHCALYSLVGFFFSCVTPAAVGDQPAQLFYMKRDGIPTPVATQVLLVVTITYKLVLVVLGAVVLLVRPSPIYGALEPVLWLCWLGLSLNVLAVASMLTLSFSPRLTRALSARVFGALVKLKILKSSERLNRRIERWMAEYGSVSTYFRGHKAVVWNVFLITVAQRFLLFAVTYLVFRSFGLRDANFWTITCLQGMIAVAVEMLPIPGGMGVAEHMFLSIFAPACGELTLPILVVSRLISYYTQLLLSALMTIVAHFKILHGEGKKGEIG